MLKHAQLHFLLLVLAQTPAPEVKLPAEIRASWPAGFVTLTAETNQKDVQWYSVSPEFQLVPREILKDSKYALGLPTKPGRYMVLAWVAEGGIPSKPAVCWIQVGDPGPMPPPQPQPPIPQPPIPNPPTPAPSGFRVILVYESSMQIPKAQVNALYSVQVEEYLNKKCAEGKRGWRRFDKDIDVSNETPVFQALWKVAKPQITKLPAIVVVNDSKGEVYALPDTEQQLLDFLVMFAGR